jgi:hypothetical protein
MRNFEEELDSLEPGYVAPATIRVIWPEDREVPEAEITARYQDHVVDGDIDLVTSDVWEQALQLQDVGVITLGYKGGIF